MIFHRILLCIVFIDECAAMVFGTQYFKHLVKVTREKANREDNPTYAFIDSQSVKTTYAGDQLGFDGEKTKGRKRQIATDTLGCLLGMVVHRANLVDTTMGI